MAYLVPMPPYPQTMTRITIDCYTVQLPYIVGALYELAQDENWSYGDDYGDPTDPANLNIPFFVMLFHSVYANISYQVL